MIVYPSRIKTIIHSILNKIYMFWCHWITHDLLPWCITRYSFPCARCLTCKHAQELKMKVYTNTNNGREKYEHPIICFRYSCPKKIKRCALGKIKGSYKKVGE